jgi:hypothetical protein
VEIPEEVRLADALTKLALSLLNERSLKSDLERLARVGCELIPECSGASVSMVVEGETSTVAVTDRVSLQLDLIQYDNNEGPCVAALGGEAVRIGFIPADQRFPHFAIGAADRRVLSVLSTPAIDHGKVEDAFDDGARHTALIIAAEVANALVKSAVLSEASSLRDQLQEQHDSAALVSMAQGVLMATHDCSKAQAHDLITSAAEANNERIVTVAERILSTIDRNERPASEGRSTAVDN